jgi:hypothetical protein
MRHRCPEYSRPMIAETVNYLPVWYCIEHELMVVVLNEEMESWKKYNKIDEG